jgi:hypothetical protein
LFLSLGNVGAGRPKAPHDRHPSVGLLVAEKTIGTILSEEDMNMLWTIFVILLLLWALGLVTSYTMGGMIHLLLVIALVVVVIQLVQGRRVV